MQMFSFESKSLQSTRTLPPKHEQNGVDIWKVRKMQHPQKIERAQNTPQNAMIGSRATTNCGVSTKECTTVIMIRITRLILLLRWKKWVAEFGRAKLCSFSQIPGNADHLQSAIGGTSWAVCSRRSFYSVNSACSKRNTTEGRSPRWTQARHYFHTQQCLTD